MSLLSAGLSLLKADLIADELPVLAKSIALLQAQPNALGRAAAVQNLLANAPIAALSAEADTVAALNQATSNDLNSLVTKAEADAAAAKAALAGTAKPAS